jgi:hypothetical protein
MKSDYYWLNNSSSLPVRLPGAIFFLAYRPEPGNKHTFISSPVFYNRDILLGYWIVNLDIL